MVADSLVWAGTSEPFEMPSGIYETQKMLEAMAQDLSETPHWWTWWRPGGIKRAFQVTWLLDDQIRLNILYRRWIPTLVLNPKYGTVGYRILSLKGRCPFPVGVGSRWFEKKWEDRWSCSSKQALLTRDTYSVLRYFVSPQHCLFILTLGTVYLAFTLEADEKLSWGVTQCSKTFIGKSLQKFKVFLQSTTPTKYFCFAIIDSRGWLLSALVQVDNTLVLILSLIHAQQLVPG